MSNLGEIMMCIHLEKMGKYILLGEYPLQGVSGKNKLSIVLNIVILLLGKYQVFGVFKPVVMMRRGPCLRPPPKRTRGWSTTS